jgi:hypothetical protein
VVIGLVELGDARSITIAGAHAFVARWDGPNGPTFLDVVDITNPLAAEVVSSTYVPDRVMDVVVAGSHAFVASISSLQVIDVSDPQQPTLVGNADLPNDDDDPEDTAFGVALSNTHVCVADGIWGLRLLPLPCGMSTSSPASQVPTSFRPIAVFPNPAPHHATIRYEAPPHGTVRVSVYDVAGRLVRALYDGPSRPGVNDMIWNGQDEWGRTASTGVYLVRVSTAAGSSSERLTLVR